MISALFYIAGAATVGIFFTLWCVVSVERVKKEYVTGVLLKRNWISLQRPVLFGG